MKKKIIYTTIILIFSVCIIYYILLPDFHIFSGMSFCHGTNRITTLHVIVYQYHDTDKIIKDIENEHNNINGIPSTLTINLYRSKYQLQNRSNPFRTITIKYK